MKWHGKRYWLVGASEGLGLALAQLLSAKGAEVILSARSRPALEIAKSLMPGPVQILPLDVADGSAVAKAAADLEAQGLLRVDPVLDVERLDDVP